MYNLLEYCWHISLLHILSSPVNHFIQVPSLQICLISVRESALYPNRNFIVEILPCMVWMYGAILITLLYKILVHDISQIFHESNAVYCRIRLFKQIVDLFSIHVLSGFGNERWGNVYAKKVISHWWGWSWLLKRIINRRSLVRQMVNGFICGSTVSSSSNRGYVTRIDYQFIWPRRYAHRRDGCHSCWS